jgi:F420-dependent oxidoreductase-like protein
VPLILRGGDRFVTHLGLQLPSFTFAGVPDAGMFERIAETALAAEESGFDSFWVMDHYHQIAGVGPETDPMLEAYTLLAGVGARTSRISVGAMVTGVVYRNPAFLAKVVTTLDVVTAGRAILGIGAAWNQGEAEAYGYRWPPTRERMERLEDALRICRAMFTQERSTVEGTHHHVRGALNVPRPVRPGGPPIMIGGGGERRTLRLVARYADMWNGFGDVPILRHKLEVLEGHCRDAGRDPGEIVKTRLGTLLVAPTMDEAKRRVADLGMPEERQRMVLTWGDPSTVAEAARELLDAGMDGLLFNMPVGSTPEDVALAGRALRDGLK